MIDAIGIGLCQPDDAARLCTTVLQPVGTRKAEPPGHVAHF
jgi:hypothetical protein